MQQNWRKKTTRRSVIITKKLGTTTLTGMKDKGDDDSDEDEDDDRDESITEEEKEKLIKELVIARVKQIPDRFALGIG